MNKPVTNILFLFIAPILLFSSCGKNFTLEELKYIQAVENDRNNYNEWLKDDPDSPFNKKGKVEFHPLNYYDVDPTFIFKSKLYEYDKKDTILTYGTKGDERRAVSYGYLIIRDTEEEHKLNLYEGELHNGEKYYSIWFTDKTTNGTTYGVGRYLNFEKNNDPEFVYEIDFNKAYNPYCAYTSNYSCTIPTKEDYLAMAIKAGEKKFHD
ncbi:MAG: DUF1684 domain-containing protein [Ignavibacteria bacterium]|jgi:uncharacterized protein (DUF1684 family)